MANERIVAVGLLTCRDLQLLGPTFDRVWPVDESPAFSGLLGAIDDAEREPRRSAEPLSQPSKDPDRL